KVSQQKHHEQQTKDEPVSRTHKTSNSIWVKAFASLILTEFTHFIQMQLWDRCPASYRSGFGNAKMTWSESEGMHVIF
ncbi:MAG: hypothetical protein MK438_09375, partial [SAR324 cluster bacterium]|nr:hypothetical protein [SAR324 cluster bacterium]